MNRETIVKWEIECPCQLRKPLRKWPGPILSDFLCQGNAREGFAKAGLFPAHFDNKKLTVELSVSSHVFGYLENLNKIVSLMIASN